MVLCLMVMLILFVPGGSFGDDVERDLKGFSKQIQRSERARRALERGKVYLEDSSYALARRELTRALLLDPGISEARFCLGMVESRSGNHKLAVDHFTRVYLPGARQMQTSPELAQQAPKKTSQVSGKRQTGRQDKKVLR